MTKQNYNNDSIKSVDDRWVIRNRTSTYTGSIDAEGVFNLVKEIVSNSIDEHNAGFGNNLLLEYNTKTGTVKVQDTGRGIPLDWNEKENKYNYELLLYTLNAGGKYDDNSYGSSSGLNGVGLAVTSMSSKNFEIISTRDGFNYTVKGENGTFTEKLKEKSDCEDNGTTVTWTPSDEVFDTVTFPTEWLYEYLETQAIVNKQLRITLIIDGGQEGITYYYENGIKDYFEILSKNTIFTDNQFISEYDVVGSDKDNKDDYKSSYEILFAFTNENPNIKMFHNSLPMTEGGVTLDAIKKSFTDTINEFIIRENLYKNKEKPIIFEDIQDSLLIITNTKSTGYMTKWKHQTKRAVGNLFVKKHMTELISNYLTTYFIENIKSARTIAQQILVNKRAREKADKTKIDTRKKYSKVTNTMVDDIPNYYPPRNKVNKGKRYLAVVEGLSALGSIATSRDENVWGIFPTRGKILNCSKATIEQILKDEVITHIFKLLGCGVEIGKKGDKSYTFDINSLQFDKIVIFTDSDVDGMHIRALYVAMFERLAPTLLRKGKIYIGVTPRYEIVTSNDEEYYAFDDETLEQVKKDLGKTKYNIQYVKGLGELGEKAREKCFDSSGDNLYQLILDEDGLDKLETFMGKDVEPRKKLILETF